MTLAHWESNGWLKREPTSSREVSNLLGIVDRDLRDATGPISADWKFGIAYNAASKLCQVLLRAEGYRATHGLQHFRTLSAMPLVLGDSRRDDAAYLDTCRIKRNTVEYDYVGGVSTGDAAELLDFTTAFHGDVLAWLQQNHSSLLGDPSA